VFILATTSRPDLIDPALLRPGRLGTWIHCPTPNAEEKKDILKKLFEEVFIFINTCIIYYSCYTYTAIYIYTVIRI